MSDAALWLWFGAPLTMAVIACAGLSRAWKTTTGRTEKLLAVGSTTIVALYACGALAYVEVIGPLPAFDYRIEGLGFVLSALAFTAGVVALRAPQWFSIAALVSTGWLLGVFFMASLTY